MYYDSAADWHAWKDFQGSRWPQEKVGDPSTEDTVALLLHGLYGNPCRDRMCKKHPIELCLLVHVDIYSHFLFNDNHRQSIILNTRQNSSAQWFFKVYSRNLRAPETSAAPLWGVQLTLRCNWLFTPMSSEMSRHRGYLMWHCDALHGHQCKNPTVGIEQDSRETYQRVKWGPSH